MTDAKNKKRDLTKNNCSHLRLHYLVISLLYVTGILIAYKTLSLPGATKDLVALLSSGAILATFRSAIGAIGQIWQNDLLERVRLNVDILYKDIIKQDDHWRRWPFLPRSGRTKLLDGNSHHLTVSNPKIPLDVGTHVLKVDLPTVLEDFFDLPLIKNFWPLFRFRNSAHTTLNRKTEGEKDPATGLEPTYEYMAYECMFDIWKSILKFRIARYVVHFGSCLTIAGAAMSGFYVAVQYA